MMHTGQSNLCALFSQLLMEHFALELQQGAIIHNLHNQLKAETILYFKLVSL